MSKINFQSFSGYVTQIDDFLTSPNNEDSGCHKAFVVENDAGMIVHFIISPDTYFVDHAMIAVGDRITGYYDGDMPVALIYPPRYQALIVVKENPYQQVKVDYFNHNLVSSDGQLMLNISPVTFVSLTNGQAFSNTLANRNLIVSYGPTTKSIPAQTTPYEIIVYCRMGQ
ncbi:hypothetical protein [Oceanobacillus sp. FSL H7-0719]|uniref:hypothetical protein n=1 Tax=Oceanobacillus sp. FSL H7-0719 TaxID=2954507 RepID=UPI00324B3428